MQLNKALKVLQNAATCMVSGASGRLLGQIVLSCYMQAEPDRLFCLSAWQTLPLKPPHIICCLASAECLTDVSEEQIPRCSHHFRSPRSFPSPSPSPLSRAFPTAIPERLCGLKLSLARVDISHQLNPRGLSVWNHRGHLRIKGRLKTTCPVWSPSWPWAWPAISFSSLTSGVKPSTSSALCTRAARRTTPSSPMLPSSAVYRTKSRRTNDPQDVPSATSNKS